MKSPQLPIYLRPFIGVISLFITGSRAHLIVTSGNLQRASLAVCAATLPDGSDDATRGWLEVSSLWSNLSFRFFCWGEFWESFGFPTIKLRFFWGNLVWISCCFFVCIFFVVLGFFFLHIFFCGFLGHHFYEWWKVFFCEGGIQQVLVVVGVTSWATLTVALSKCFSFVKTFEVLCFQTPKYLVKLDSENLLDDAWCSTSTHRIKKSLNIQTPCE